jgi:glycosyltransferase involved in cell wall biosynthesis
LRVVAIIAAYNEADVIEPVIRALVDDGIQVYFIDNHSSDATVARVEPFVGRGVLHVERFPDGQSSGELFAWERILERKEALARELDADWFIHHDADEFRESPWPGVSLREGIQRADAAGYDAIDFELLNFRPTAGDVETEADVRHRMLYYERAETWNRVQVKCWKNTRQPVQLVASGGHSAEFAGRHVFPIRFLLRHYPIRSQAHGERKVHQERIPRFTAAERQRGWHVQYDDVRAGMSFLYDVAALTKYDGERIRLDLLIRHREVERVERALAVSEEGADSLAAASASLQVELARRDDRIRELEELVRSQEGQLSELRPHLARQDAELARLRLDIETWDTQRESLRQHLAAQDEELSRLRPIQAELAAAETRLARIESSAIRRLTAPFRSIQRIWSRRP